MRGAIKQELVTLIICIVDTYLHLIPRRAKLVREVANLTERKNPHTPVYGVKEFVRLSVCDKL